MIPKIKITVQGCIYSCDTETNIFFPSVELTVLWPMVRRNGRPHGTQFQLSYAAGHGDVIDG